MQVPEPLRIGPKGAELKLICPETKRPLVEFEGRVVSRDDSGNILRVWKRENGFLDLVLGERFEDTIDGACRCYEVESNTYSTQNFWIPHFQRLFPDYRQKTYRLLAIGCGVGTEVDVLCQSGFACFGVDNGNRTVEWPKRVHSEGLLLANAMHLPFENGAFDAVFCGCVFPHVGVVGDTNVVSKHCAADRQQLANEMVRVTRKGGHLIAASPNRRFPLDIFHGRNPGSYLPKVNPPWSRFLLSVGDYRRMLMTAGCSRVQALPVDGFWGFINMRNSLKGRILSLPIRVVFTLASHPAGAFLRPSPLLPWIAVGGQV